MTAANTTLWSFITHASWVVQLVMILLFIASILSWTIIFQRTLLFKQYSQSTKNFIQRFGAIDLNQLFQQLEQTQQQTRLYGLENIYYAGIREFKRLQKQPAASAETLVEGSQRAMRIAAMHETNTLEQHLSFLATVGSTSPYIGLFGTVWGIMTAFQALGSVQQATIAMVAPGISEALIATAIGLFAAIPAVIAYNRFNSRLAHFLNQNDMFQDELINILQRQTIK